jgi:predicted acylesterase/phospholipase RssA
MASPQRREPIAVIGNFRYDEKTMKLPFHTTLLAVALTVFPCAVSFSADTKDDLLVRTVPIFPGEKAFRARIEGVSGDKRPLGVLLSGGSARAYAHIGVLKRLEEANVKPDFIVANSMGGIVALLYASGMAPDDIERIISTTPMSELFSPKLPVGGGIMNPYRFMDILYDLFGDVRIEDFPIPVLIVCNDLKTKRQVWVTEGRLSEVMRAAFSMPVYFDPVPMGDFMLVDGGTTNLVPVNVVASFTDRMIIATTFYNNDRLNYRNTISILNLNFSIAKELTALEMIRDFDPPLIRCDVEDVSFMDYARISELVARGYRSCDREIDSVVKRVGLNPRPDPENRAELSERRVAMQRRIMLGEPFTRHDGRAFARLAIAFPASYGSNRHFIDDPYAAVYAVAETGPFSLACGPSSSLLEPEPAGSAEIRLGPFGPFSLDSYGRYTADYRYAQATARALFWLPFPVAWMPFVEGEAIADDSDSIADSYARGGLKLSVASRGILRPELVAYAFARHQDVSGVGGEVSLAIAPVRPLEFRGRAIGRYGLSGPDAFDLFRNDGYRGIMPERTPIPHAILNGEIALNADRLSYAFAETILLTRIDLAAYVDHIESDSRATAAGLSLTTTAALIGLSPLSLTAFGGWDFAEKAPYLTFKVGSLFGNR